MYKPMLRIRVLLSAHRVSGGATMTPYRIGRMSSGGRFCIVCIAVCRRPLRGRAGPSHARLGLGSMQVVDTGRKAQFDKENPGYLASGATHDGRG